MWRRAAAELFCRAAARAIVRGVGAVLTVTLLMSSGDALAACLPNSGTAVSNDIVNCTGTEPNGFQAGVLVDTLKVTVQPGATVQHSGFGAIVVNDGNEVTNRGTITGGVGSVGIAFSTNNTILNAGTILLGDFGRGLFGLGALGAPNNIRNSGVISVGSDGAGIFVIGASNTIINDGLITVGSGAALAAGIYSGGVGTGNVIENNGRIVVGPFGIGILLEDGATSVINRGAIVAGSQGFSLGECLCQASNNTVTNYGTLDGQILLSGGGNTLNNYGVITITDPNTPIGPVYYIADTYVQFPGARLDLRVTPDTTIYDSLEAVLVVQLNGGTLRAVVQAGLYNSTQTYLGVVLACGCTGVVAGAFDSVISSSPFLRATATYVDTNADTFIDAANLTLDRVPFGSVPGMTINQRNVGNALEQFYSPTITGGAATLYSNLFAATSVGALDQLSGEGVTGAQQAAFFSGDLFMAMLLNQVALAGGTASMSGGVYAYAPSRKREHPAFKSIAPPPPPAEDLHRWKLWTNGYGGSGTRDGDALTGSADVSFRGAGGGMGLSYLLNPDVVIGFGVGASTSRFSVPDRATSGELRGGQGGVYGRFMRGPVFVTGALGYARFSNDTTRNIVGVGPTEVATGSFDSSLLSGRLEFGWRQSFGTHTVTPFAAVQFAHLRQDGFTETSSPPGGGPGVLGLTFASHQATSLPTFLGVRGETVVSIGSGHVIIPFAKVAWMHEFRAERSVDAAFVVIPGSNFTVFGPEAARDAARVEAGVRVPLYPTAMMYGKFDGEFSGRGNTYAGTGGLSVVW